MSKEEMREEEEKEKEKSKKADTLRESFTIIMRSVSQPGVPSS